MDTISRGEYLLMQSGGGVGGYVKASVEGFQNASQFGTTIWTWPTPGGWIGLRGLIEGGRAYFQ